MKTTDSPQAQPQEAELKPCPFCGSRARLTVIAEHLAPAQNGFPVHLECGGTTSCFSQYFVSETAAVTFWNTRVDLPRATVDEPDNRDAQTGYDIALNWVQSLSGEGIEVDEINALGSRITAAITAARTTPRATEGELTVEAWQPIETAPRDGSWQLVGRFDGDTFLWWQQAQWHVKRSYWRTHGGIVEPTHFMKVPRSRAQTGLIVQAALAELLEMFPLAAFLYVKSEASYTRSGAGYPPESTVQIDSSGFRARTLEEVINQVRTWAKSRDKGKKP